MGEKEVFDFTNEAVPVKQSLISLMELEVYEVVEKKRYV